MIYERQKSGEMELDFISINFKYIYYYSLFFYISTVI